MYTIVHVAVFLLINTIIVLLGYWLVKKSFIAFSWLLLIASVGGMHFIFLFEGPVIRMLAIIATTFIAMKVIAVTQTYKDKRLTLTFTQWFVFATGWAGMRAQPFETLGDKALPGGLPMIKFGISRFIAGLTLILVAHLVTSLHIGLQFRYFILSMLSLVGLSMVLHFGLLSISAGIWRFMGANTYYLFRQPAKALSLTEFWSKRWNLAFSEMTAIAIFRPLKGQLGSGIALTLAFMFSGLLHELALSVPVSSGYGLPMIYFVIQGSVVLVEKGLIIKKITLLQNKLIARLWVLFWLVVPIPLLFNEQFIKQVVFPLTGLTAV
jgi:hypothetical protein